MANIKKAIIEKIVKAKREVWSDDYDFDVGFNKGLEEAKNIIISILKEQKPKLPIQQGDSLCHCPGCRTVVMDKQKYCHECGQAMKWN